MNGGWFIIAIPTLWRYVKTRQASSGLCRLCLTASCFFCGMRCLSRYCECKFLVAKKTRWVTESKVQIPQCAQWHDKGLSKSYNWNRTKESKLCPQTLCTPEYSWSSFRICTWPILTQHMKWFKMVHYIVVTTWHTLVFAPHQHLAPQAPLWDFPAAPTTLEMLPPHRDDHGGRGFRIGANVSLGFEPFERLCLSLSSIASISSNNHRLVWFNNHRLSSIASISFK